MEVTFRRTGERRYAVVAEPEGHPAVTMDPAPGFDPRLPHDLVHYAVEREHGIELGVFGQLAAGGNLRTFRRLDATPDRGCDAAASASPASTSASSPAPSISPRMPCGPGPRPAPARRRAARARLRPSRRASAPAGAPWRRRG